MKKEVILVSILENGIINSEQTKTFDDSTDADNYAREIIKNICDSNDCSEADDDIESALDDGYWLFNDYTSGNKIELFITCITHCYNN